MASTKTPLIDPDELVQLSWVLPARHAWRVERAVADAVAAIPVGEAPAAFGAIDPATWNSSSFSPEHNSNYRGEDDPWEVFEPLADDPASWRDACWIVDNLTDGGRVIVAELLAAGDGGIRTFRLAESAGYERSGISSAIRHIAGRFRACARQPFWKGNLDTKGHAMGQVLNVSTESDAYRIMREAMAARFPDVAG